MLHRLDSHMQTNSRLTLSLFAVCTTLVAQADVPRFATSSLTEIREQASTAPIAIVIDFSHDGCEPCRRLLQTTWNDVALWQWLEGKAVVVRIDPEKDQAAAKEFALIAYPTIIVLDKDGKEASRSIGYRDAQTLRQELEDSIQPLPTNWKERKAIGDALQRKGDHAGALRHYLWLWDHGDESSRGFGGVRVTSFLRDFMSLAKKYEPAREALEQRRDAYEAKILNGDIDFRPVSDMVHLNRALGTRERNIAVLDKVPAKNWEKQEIARRVLVRDAIEVLNKQKRYADAARYLGDPVAALNRELEPMGMVPLPEALQERMTQMALRKQGAPLEAFFAIKDNDATSRLTERLFEIQPGVTTWIMVLEAAKRAGNDVACHDYAVRALQELPEADHEKVRRFLKRK
jgi:thioredoxin 1